jgi:[ribosomal protein S5]-alanine N-acetyltransferase
MDLVRIQAMCFVENTASARVMQKVGMTFEGILRKAMFVKGSIMI